MVRVTANPDVANAGLRNLLDALADPDHLFTGKQLAWFIELDRRARDDDPDEPELRSMMYRSGFEAGYQARVAEENADYRLMTEQLEADPGRGDLQRLIAVVDARREADRAGRLPRVGDFAGGLPLPGRQGEDHDESKAVA